MIDTIQAVLHNSVVRGALTMALGAAYVDIAAFRKWQSVHEALEYNWSLAAWRWFQGAVLGALAALGLNTVS